MTTAPRSSYDVPSNIVIYDKTITDPVEGNKYKTWATALAAAQQKRGYGPVKLVWKLDFLEGEDLPVGVHDMWDIALCPDGPFSFFGIADGCQFEGLRVIGDNEINSTGLLVLENKNTTTSPIGDPIIDSDFVNVKLASSGLNMVNTAGATVPWISGDTEFIIDHVGMGTEGFGEIPGFYNPAVVPCLDASAGGELVFRGGALLGRGAIGGNGSITIIDFSHSRDHSTDDDTDYSAYRSTVHPEFSGSWNVDNKDGSFFTTGVNEGAMPINGDFDMRYGHADPVDTTAADVNASWPNPSRRNGAQMKYQNYSGANNIVCKPGSLATGTPDSFAITGTTVTLVKAGAAFGHDMVGKEVDIAGATSGGNDGSFVITSRVDADTITYENAAGVSEAGAGSYNVKSGKANGSYGNITVGPGKTVTFTSGAHGEWMVEISA